jgi:dephospho-CoA kinase
VIRLGLTGSLAMGKSTTARLFAEAGAAIYDADAAVHALYAAGGGGAEALAPEFPEAVQADAVDRPALARRLKADPTALKRLERIVHPLLAAWREAMLAAAEAAGTAVAVLDIPLLFEVGAQDQVDAVVVVTAPSEVQRARALARPGMDAETFALLSGRQLPDAEKRAQADFLVQTGEGLESARREVQAIMAAVTDPGWRAPRRR